LIPILCKKVGIPAYDVRGRITSHRARSTITSQLFNAKEPMGLFELQQFLGHASPASTQRYLRITPTKLAKSYSDAGYFARNIRAVEVLIDQDAVRSGTAATEPWKFCDLGHGYCTYDFFDQCPYRMALSSRSEQQSSPLLKNGFQKENVPDGRYNVQTRRPLTLCPMNRFHCQLRLVRNDLQQGGCRSGWTTPILFPVLKCLYTDANQACEL
jgi:hypothetical protein